MNETYQEQRRKYLAGEMTFAEFYRWRADQIGGPKVLRPLIPASLGTIREALQEGDEHLNSIPLRWWDTKDGIVRSYAGAQPWSLCDTVCVLKQVARDWAEEEA